ncbi:MAG TPA: TIGR02594 family protein [Hyphomicrobium sp.]|nr:TIGR02594 family protein [Hyphomicrobium sp.]HRO49241.1 TIGR02594 family protein [Hyphomicrobium sp.]
MDEAFWLKEAWREYGQAERAGARANPRLVALFRDAGHPKVTRDEVAWCAAYVGAILERTGIRSTRSLMARSYLAWGEPLAEPRVGAVAVFSRGRNPALGHVGFWLGETDGDVVLLGGNQGNAVSVARYPKSRLLELRWPQPQRDGNLFDRALTHVLAMEGGFTDDPQDPGGPTNKGITLGVFAAWRKVRLSAGNRAGMVRDLKRIDGTTVREIYRRRYWDVARCAELPAPLALMHFDAAVNHGPGTAIRILQEAVGTDVDGKIGPNTRAAIARTPLSDALAAYAAIRERRYRALPHFGRFGRGWLRRVAATLKTARALAASPIAETFPKREGEKDMSNIPTPSGNGKWWGHSVTIWGTIITMLSVVVPAVAPVTGIDISGDEVRDAGEQTVEAIQAVGALVGTLLTILGRMRASQPIERAFFKAKE